jgi:hypothetical protein
MAWRGPTIKPVVNKPPHNPVNTGPEMSDSKKPVAEAAYGPNYKPNRAYNVRRDKDSEKNLSISLIDIDSTILTHLDGVISPTVIDSGRQVKVPINYASPERWKAIRKDGAMRDKNGKIQTPAIAFRRSTMQRNDSLITLNRYLQYPTVKKFSQKNQYDKFSVMNGFEPVQEIYSVAMPDHVIINYEFIIWTELIEQSNAIVEAINFSTEDYWGDKKRFKFRTSISDFNFETSTEAGNDRLVRSTFTLIANAYLLPDKFENYKSVVQKAFTPRKVVFGIQENIKNATVDTFAAKSIPVSFGSTSPAPSAGGGFPGITQIANYANFAGAANTANSANFAVTASYVDTSQTTGNFQGIVINGEAGATGSIGTNVITNVNASDGTTDIDSIPISVGNAARWLVSINDGIGGNFKTSEVVASWNFVGNFRYNNTEVSEVGSVPVVLSVNNVGSNITLQATPFSGIWTIKMIRTMV